jgi:outer membrane protein assembly factor BamB
MQNFRGTQWGLFVCSAWVAAFGIANSGHAENWPRFRGPNGSGVSSEKGFPITWSEGDYLWKTKLPGLGHSSPCVWDDHVFITAAEENGQKRTVLDVSASTGKIRWQWSMDSPTYKIHRLSSFASATPATDGKRVYVPISKEDSSEPDPKADPDTLVSPNSEYALFAFDFEGKQLWKCVIGTFESQHGSGSSPIVFEDLVIIGNDQDGVSSLVAVDSETGKIRWKVKRNESKYEQATCYGTPLLIPHDDGQVELIVTSRGDGFTSYDPRTGKLNWRAKIIPDRVVSSPVFGHGMVFQLSGGGGDGHFLGAVRLGGHGEIGETTVAWKRTTKIPYVPTPILYGDYLYLWGDKGVVSCVNAESGAEIWSNRVPGEFSGSPVCIDGKLYCMTQDGEVVVVDASPEFKILGRTNLGEGSHATIAVSNGRMFLRSFEHLFCLEADRAKARAGGGR